MNRRRPRGQRSPYTVRPGEIFRVRAGKSWDVLFLSRQIGGLLYHWFRDQSWYCPPEGGCDPQAHKTRVFWHGYVAAQVWDELATKWQPVVCEITEALEQQLRDTYQRGQLWRLSRADDNVHNSKIVGVLVEQRDLTTCPPPPDIRPALCQLYHTPLIDLSSPNPLPALPTVQAIQTPAPPTSSPAVPEQPVSAEVVREQLRRAGFRPGSSEAARNGHKRGVSEPS
jgi:hypothetical protein